MSEHLDPDSRSAIERRAERGEPRGADVVFAAARRESGGRSAGPRRLAGPMLAAAAAVLLVAGLAWFFSRGEADPIELEVANPSEVVPAICDQGFVVVGRLADDPAGLCATSASPVPTGYETLRAFGTLDARVAATPGGGWMIDVAPRPDLQGAVELPADGAGGAAMLLAEEPVPVDDGFDVTFALAVGHRDYRGDRNPGAWYEVMLTPSREPGDLRTGPLYLGDWFAGATTLSCRFELLGNTVCRLTGSDDAVIWQTSFVDDAGDQPSVGGFERDDRSFTPCGPDDPIASCLDTMRLRFADNTLTIDVNGLRYFEQPGLPDLPEELRGDMAWWTAVVTSRSELEHLRFHGGAPPS